MRLVVVETPYAGDVATNLHFLACCMRDCLRRGEAPYASYGLYTSEGCLDDDKPEERELGIAAGLAWGDKADARVVYTNLGISAGMERGIQRAAALGQPVEMRELDQEQWPTDAAAELRRRAAPARPRSTSVPAGPSTAGPSGYFCTGCLRSVPSADAVEVPTAIGHRYAHPECRDQVAEIVKQEAKRRR